jgi:hypothetical protein
VNLAEAEAFLAQRVAAKRTVFDLGSILFGPQLAFVQDPAPFADAVCSRRAGKSVGIGAWLAEGPLIKPKAPSLYLTQTRGAAKRIIWSTLLDLNRRYRLGYEPNEAELVLKRNGVGMVYLAGLDNKSEIEKARGTGWGRVAIDEAQSLPQYVKELVEDVLMPSLMDHDGQIRMIGTPAPVPVGYFHDVTTSPEWTHHRWTVWENPHVPNARAMLEKVLKARGLTTDDPSIQREWWGRWVLDLNSLVFRYDAAKNGYTALPKAKAPWRYVIGVDFGHSDADAVALLAYSDDSPCTWLVEEWTLAKAGISPVMEKVMEMRSRVGDGNVTGIVCDPAGMGTKIITEFQQRFQVPAKAADKQAKVAYIELLNDAMRTGRFFARPSGIFAHDAMLVEWDRDKSTNERRVISDRFHSDICDAVLYAFRESLAWTHDPPPAPGPAPGTPEYAAMEADRMEREEEERIAQEIREQQGEPEGLSSPSDWENGWQ